MGDKVVDPSTVIRVAFSEPIHPDAGLIQVTANGTAVPFRLLSRGRPVGAPDLAQDLWIVPDQRLGLGSEVRVELGALVDSDAQPQSLAAMSWSFTIRGA